MALNKEQIEHIALLARLELTDEEKQKFSGQLSDILDSFEKLKSIDTTDVPETSQVIALKNVHRADEVKDCEGDVQKRIIENFPDKSSRLIKVNKVL